MPLSADASLNDFLSWPYLSEDLLTLCFCHGDTRPCVVYLADRPKTDAQRLGNYRPVTIAGKPLTGRSPRYLAARGELYLSSDAEPIVPDSELYMVSGLSLPKRTAASHRPI